MRTALFTLLLVFTTAILGVLAFLQMREGSLKLILGSPPVAIGEKIYPDLQPERITSILVRNNTLTASFEKTPDGWISTSPWRDRMDPRAAFAILTFANIATAEDLVPRDKLDPTRAGLNNSTEIQLLDSSGKRHAYFRLGRRTPWLQLPATENPEPVPTTYLLPLESGRKSHVYAASGDILPLFKDGFGYLRDHRPFYFNPLALEKIRLRTAQGDLTLGRAAPDSPWRIVKPLDLPTNPTAVKTLLEGLVTLQATKLADRGEVTLPTDGASSRSTQIAFTPFGATAETLMEIFPPETADARETQAIVSNRPDTLFTLPLKSEPSLTSLSDLPLTVNELRDPTLTNLNIASVRGIAIRSTTSPTILISREPPAPWIATIGGKEQPANEQRLYELLKAVTSTRALAFETDAAAEDLSTWGLNRPILTLTFLAENKQALTLLLGLDKSGDLFAKRNDSATIMRIENAFLEKIATRSHDWRHARLWSLSVVDLQKLTRADGGEPPIELAYVWNDEKWQAARSGADLTSSLDPARSNFLLKALENLQVSRWLSPTDETARTALKNPTLTFTVTEDTVDDFGEKNGTQTRTLTLAPDPATNLIYGKLDSDPDYFTLATESYIKLNIPLLDE